jgi:hypothetical protein
MLGANGLTPRRPSVAKPFGSDEMEAVVRRRCWYSIRSPSADAGGVTVTRQYIL